MGCGDRGRFLTPVALLLTAGAVAIPEPGRAQDVQEPRPTELVEETESRLAQLDVTITGPPEIVSTLGPDDFRLKIHMRWIEDFEIDRACGPTADDESSGPPGNGRLPVQYVFYFDQAQLTLPGRARALAIAGELVNRLVTNGDRAMVVSSGRRLEVIEEFTDDRERLHAAIERLDEDRNHWDFFANEEDSRVARVVDVLNEDENVKRAISTARGFQREERSRTDKSLRRLAITLSRLSELESHKGVLYFADTLRQRPGEHYLSFFGYDAQRADASLSDLGSDAFAAGAVFDRVINEAVAQGVRLYPVYAAGLVTPFDREHVSADGLARGGSPASSSRVRFRDAQDTMASMASETGGHVFLRGESPARISRSILADFSCLYTLSFDPTVLPQDQPLRVIVQVLREGVSSASRGRIVLQSASGRLSSRLLSAFSLSSAADADVGLHANLVPIGFDDGRYVALLQISVPGTMIPATEWELGATLIGKDKVIDEISGGLSVQRPGVPLVLEREITMRPGPHEIVAVAHEAKTDFILSERRVVSWPNPNDRPITCVPLALVQHSAGAFVREGATRKSGSLARSDAEPISVELPTALMGLVCRNRRYKGSLRIERSLIGGSAVDFPLLQFDLADDRCAQVRDVIPAGTLMPGSYRYVIRVLSDGQQLDKAVRDFVAYLPES